MKEVKKTRAPYYIVISIRPGWSRYEFVVWNSIGEKIFEKTVDRKDRQAQTAVETKLKNAGDFEKLHLFYNRDGFYNPPEMEATIRLVFEMLRSRNLDNLRFLWFMHRREQLADLTAFLPNCPNLDYLGIYGWLMQDPEVDYFDSGCRQKESFFWEEVAKLRNLRTIYWVVTAFNGGPLRRYTRAVEVPDKCLKLLRCFADLRLQAWYLWKVLNCHVTAYDVEEWLEGMSSKLTEFYFYGDDPQQDSMDFFLRGELARQMDGRPRLLDELVAFKGQFASPIFTRLMEICPKVRYFALFPVPRGQLDKADVVGLAVNFLEGPWEAGEKQEQLVYIIHVQIVPHHAELRALAHQVQASLTKPSTVTMIPDVWRMEGGPAISRMETGWIEPQFFAVTCEKASVYMGLFNER